MAKAKKKSTCDQDLEKALRLSLKGFADLACQEGVVFEDKEDLDKEESRTPAELLRNRADVFEQRNAVYGDNFLKVGLVMEDLFPDGITLKGADAFNLWHLFELQIVKLTRFTNSKLTHVDSIMDEGVYGAMVESLIRQGKKI